MNFTVLSILIICVIVVIYVYTTIHIIKKQRIKLTDLEMNLKEAITEKSVLSEEIKNLHNSMKKKQEIENETKQNLANIASGTTDDSVDRLQHPEKRRKSKTSNGNKNSNT
jgi:predicted Holliday junction resolvase-like endonuclease